MKTRTIYLFVLLTFPVFFLTKEAHAQKGEEYVNPMDGVRRYLEAHLTEPLNQEHCDVIVESTRLRYAGDTERLKRDDRKFRHSKKLQKEEADLHQEYLNELKELCIAAIPSGIKVFIFCRKAKDRIPNLGC